jgi:hypothetical protein
MIVYVIIAIACASFVLETDPVTLIVAIVVAVLIAIAVDRGAINESKE